MKDSAWYNRLWQSKMQDLPLEEDANAAWEKMHGLLNENMPVGTGGAPIKKAWYFHGSGFLVPVGIIVTVAMIICGLYYFHGSQSQKIVKQYNKQPKSHTEQIDSAGGRAENKHDLKNNSIRNQNSNANSNDSVSSVSTIKNSGNSIAGNGSLKENKNNKAFNKTDYTNAPLSNNNSGININTHKNTGSKNYSGKMNSSNITGIHQNNTPPAIQGGIINNQANVTGTVDSTVQNPQAVKPQSTDKGILPSSANKTADSTNAVTKNMGVYTLPNKFITNTTVDTAKAKTNHSSTKTSTKPKSNKKIVYSKFELELKAGLNTNANSSAAPFIGIAGSYYISPNISIGLGANVFSYRFVESSYTNSIYHYTTVGDSGKVINHTADPITVQGSAKLYTLDVPVIAKFKINKWLSFNLGPEISIPLRSGTIKNTLGPINNPADTSNAYKTILAAANSTTIKNNLNIGFFGGLSLNFNRFNIHATYLQGLSPYTIMSSLGTNNTNYHTFQIGVGYLVFKPKLKK